MKKYIILLTSLFMVVGFATVSTTLGIDLSTAIALDPDFYEKVYFANVDSSYGSVTLSEDKRTFTYTGNDSNNTFNFDIVNESTQYGAEVTVVCIPNDDIEINNNNITYKLDSLSAENGNVSYSNTVSSRTIICSLDVTATEKDKTAEYKNVMVTFDPNGGSVSTTSKEVTYAKIYGELPIPTKLNHDTTGWYTDTLGSRKVTSSSYVSNDSDHTLYAGWEEVTPPTLTGGSTNWATSRTIEVSQAGNAYTGLDYYDIFVSTDGTTPVESTQATYSGKTSLTFNTTGTYIVYFRTTSKSGVKSKWSTPQTVKIDTTDPWIKMMDTLPTSITKGCSHQFVHSWDVPGPSGGSFSCKSNLYGIFTDTKQLGVGTHNITCTVTSGAGKTATGAKTLKVTYDPYSATNLLKNGAFDNETNVKETWTGDISVTSGVAEFTGVAASYGSYFGTNYSVIDLSMSGHKIYIASYLKNNSNAFSFGFGALSGGTNIYASYQIKNTNNAFEHVSLIATVGSTYSKGYFGIYKSGATSTSETIYIDHVYIIDLTETFGAGNEPSIEWCDNHLGYYIDGTETVYK